MPPRKPRSAGAKVRKIRAGGAALPSPAACGREEALRLAEKEWKDKLAKTTMMGNNWPKDCVVDDGRWCSWLPDGWTLGLKRTLSKLLLQCYIGPEPERKRFFHKVDVEKYLGRSLKAGSNLKPRELSKDLQRSFPPESFLQRTEAVADKAYINTRCNHLHGLTVGEAIATFMYSNTHRKRCHYNAADLRYDLTCRRLKLTNTKPPSLRQSAKQKAAKPSTQQKRTWPSLVKNEPAAASTARPSSSSVKRCRSPEIPAEARQVADKRHRVASEGAVSKPPAHWPPNIAVQLKCRTAWLPPDWGQGVKQTHSGNTLTAYVSPQGKAYYHKKDIERLEGIDLSFAGHPPMDGIGRLLRWVSGKSAQDVGNDANVPGHWPEGVYADTSKRSAWLPLSWGQGWKKTESGSLQRVYISPAPEGKIFYCKVDIERLHFNFNKLPQLNLPLDGLGQPVQKAGSRWELIATFSPGSSAGSGSPSCSSGMPCQPGEARGPKLPAAANPNPHASGRLFGEDDDAGELPEIPCKVPRPLATTETSLQAAFSSLKGRAARSGGDQMTLYALAGFGVSRGVDPTVLSALPAAMKKEPAERGPLDALVIKSLEEELAKD